MSVICHLGFDRKSMYLTILRLWGPMMALAYQTSTKSGNASSYRWLNKGQFLLRGSWRGTLWLWHLVSEFSRPNCIKFREHIGQSSALLLHVLNSQILLHVKTTAHQGDCGRKVRFNHFWAPSAILDLSGRVFLAIPQPTRAYISTVWRWSTLVSQVADTRQYRLWAILVAFHAAISLALA